MSKYVDSYEEVMNAQKLGINVNELKKVPGLLSLLGTFIKDVQFWGR